MASTEYASGGHSGVLKNRKITSLVELVFPDGEKRQFESGVQACSAVFENRYVVKEIKAVDALLRSISSMLSKRRTG